MDEIDASLDAYIALKVGKLVKQNSSSKLCQFIVVSHRQEIHEHASRMIGLYHYDLYPKVASLSFQA